MLALWPAGSHAAWYRWHHCGSAQAWRGDGDDVPPVVAERLAPCRTLIGDHRDEVVARFHGSGRPLDASVPAGQELEYPVRLDLDQLDPIQTLIVYLSSAGGVVDVDPRPVSP